MTLARLIILWSCACASLGAGAEPRVVSLDYCADQYVLKFVAREHIAALSPDATRQFSYMRAAAVGIPTVKPLAENVLLTRPNIVVRSYGGGPGISHFLKRFEVEVVQIGYATSLEDIQQIVRDTSGALGHRAAGELLVTQMTERLAAIRTRHRAGRRPDALYMTPTGVTSGPDTLVGDLLRIAGLDNYQTQPGWQPLPLERLIYESPVVTALAFFDAQTNHASAWSAMAHPVAQRQLDLSRTVPLQGAWTSCGGWFVMEAIEALSESLADLER
ncbi:MAG: ABC transporter substrate-binding protein [Pseudomonadota bacterium]